jgi:hypothetical protein
MTFPSLAVQAATPLYLTGEDSLRLTVFNSAAGVTASLRGRFLPAKTADTEQDPVIGAFTHELVPTTARAASTRTETLGEGWLLDWSVVVSAGTPAIGQCYASVELVRGAKGSQFPLSWLGNGYVTANKRLGGPDSGFMDFLDGGGALRSITGATPGAGAEISETVPTGARWEPLAIRAVFTTSAVVANRFPSLRFDDGANAYFDSWADIPEVASVGYIHSWSQGLYGNTNGVNNFLALPIPASLRMAAGHRFRTVTTSIQGADQWNLVQYLVREWIEGA